MEDQQNPQEQQKNPQEEHIPRFRGLYRYVHISVKALDCIIAVCIAVIILATVMGMQDRGFVVNFDSRGGTDVAAVKVSYGEIVVPPSAPTREGYLFVGWFKDPSCTEPWHLGTDTVTGAMTLYADWSPKS